jgi:two-component system phosphate regulon sensor histidine kinase PhoR
VTRLGRSAGAPVALILTLALVFPAIVAAALALAYYGFQYADSMSRPIEALFRDASRDEAEKAATELEGRIDHAALSLFERIGVEKRDPNATTACEIDPGPSIKAYLVLAPGRTEECHWPPGPPGKNDFALSKLDWSAVRLGSWHHYHDLVDGHSVLEVYSPRETDEEIPYFVVARFNMDYVTRPWLEEVLGRPRKNLRVVVVDDEGRLVSGEALPAFRSERDERFTNEYGFGKALYRWHVRIAPLSVSEFQTQTERQRRLQTVLIFLSTTILAVGLGIVWLVILAERRASRLKSDFIANVSHELKTPLSLIRMFGEMVATGRHKGENAARDYGAIITRESERLSHLIDNVLDFARLERGKASYTFVEADLADLLERALDVCRYRLEKEKLKLRTIIEPGLPPVRMDDNAMTLVVLNLVDNAIKYGADGGQVDVTLQRRPGGVVLGVRDYGPGIVREEQARIFERFYRARSARDRNVRGSGIGLALVKYIAEAHGGRVAVESPVAGDSAPGALFRVYLPAPIAEEAPAPSRPEVVPPLAARKPS